LRGWWELELGFEDLLPLIIECSLELMMELVFSLVRRLEWRIFDYW